MRAAFLRIPLGLRFMAAGAFFFSLMSALVKWSGQGLPTMQIVLARSVVVAVLAGVTIVVRGGDFLGRERKFLVLRGVLGFIALSAFYYGVVHLPLADATVIQYTNPVFTALLAAVALGETLRAKEVVLTLLSLGGVVLVARPTFLFGASSHALDPVVVAVALGGAVFSAAAYVVVRRLKSERAMVVVFYFATLSVLGALPPSVVVWVRPDWIGWVVLLGVGVTTYLGQLFLTMGLQRERAGRATSIGYLQVVFAAVWGALFFGEIPDGWSVVGAALILGSTYLVARGPAISVTSV